MLFAAKAAKAAIGKPGKAEQPKREQRAGGQGQSGEEDHQKEARQNAQVTVTLLHTVSMSIGSIYILLVYPFSRCSYALNLELQIISVRGSRDLSHQDGL